MHSHAELLALRQQLVGRTVVSQRLFLYTLQLYLDRADAGGPPIEVSCGTCWQLVGPDGVITGADAIDFDPDAVEPYALHREAEQATEVLRGRAVVGLAVAPRTYELELYFDGDLTVRTFVADPTAPEAWRITIPRGATIHGSAAGLRTEPTVQPQALAG